MYCSKCGASVADSVAFCPSCGQPAGGAPVTVPAMAPGSAVRPGVSYAGFWLRFVAFIIDAIVLQFVRFALTLPFAASLSMRMFMRGRMPMSPEEWAPFAGAFGRLILISIVINWLYFALLESSAWQATLGKKALGLEVTDLAGSRISFARATGRFFAKFLSTMILLIGFIMIGFTQKKQGLHDMVAGTLVIRKI
ncbi:MAG TPA: RDD family protein [Candidatus Cybelea sp.]|nr:RDD family protein [Candidatus Cybelea sp.]